ncbi:nucleotidyltransferase domain-containing protein [Candidatus Micrarchaeota archaeon]|nr:nucleotidyltransferase domain-containing protein [Candidatus Micrarchaeota archaeon]
MEKPYASFSLSDISRGSGVSKSNVLRALHALAGIGAVRQTRGGKRKLFRIDAGKGMSLAIAGLFMQERIANLKPATKNAAEYLFSEIGDKADAFVLFGSCAYGLETPKSDIDIMVVGSTRPEISAAAFLPYRFEIHAKTWEELEKMADFVVLEAVLNGVVFKGIGRLFGIKAGVQSFPKAYVLFRLKNAMEYAERMKKARGEARRYYKELLRISQGELESLLYRGKLAPKKMLSIKRSFEEIETKVSTAGERIWLSGT